MQDLCTFKILTPILLLLSLLVFPTLAVAEYRTYEIHSLRITVDSDWPQLGAAGYFPVRFDITNLGEAREIEIVASGQHWFDPSRRAARAGSFTRGFEMGSVDIRQIVRLKRGDRQKLTMTLPAFADNENFGLRLREKGRFLEGFNSHSGLQSGRPIAEAPVLVAASSSSAVGLEAAGWLRAMPAGRYGYYGGASPGTSSPRLDYMIDPERLPNNWLGFTALRALMIGPEEWKKLDPAQQDAVLYWIAAGGDLLLLDGNAEAVLPQGQKPVGLGGTPTVLPYYLGHIHLVTSSGIRDKGFEPTIRDLGDGVVTPDWSLPAVRATDWGWIGERGFRLPITGAGNVPTRAYLSILAVFIALIGPANYIYLWRRKQQTLLVLTVPLISLTFIGLITGYGLLSAGFGVRARAVTFTLLDQNSKRAATRASVSLFPGGITTSSVRFPSDMAIFPIGTDGYGARGQMVIDLTGQQEFQTGLLKARTPGNFEQVSFQPARQRLNFERNGNELSVVNGLGSTLTSLFYRDGGQMYALAEALPAGERAALKIGTIKGKALFGEPLKTTPIAAAKFQQVIDRQPDGAYVAVLEKSPFWDPGIAKPAESGSLHFVLGFAGGQP